MNLVSLIIGIVALACAAVAFLPLVFSPVRSLREVPDEVEPALEPVA